MSYHHYHYQGTRTSWIPLNLSSSLLIGHLFGHSSKLCTLTKVRQYIGVHRITLLMSSSLPHDQWPACPTRPTWMVCETGGNNSKYPGIVQFHLFSPSDTLESKECNKTVVLTTGKNPCFFYCQLSMKTNFFLFLISFFFTVNLHFDYFKNNLILIILILWIIDAPYKTPTVRPLASYHENYSS